MRRVRPNYNHRLYGDDSRLFQGKHIIRDGRRGEQYKPMEPKGVSIRTLTYYVCAILIAVWISLVF